MTGVQTFALPISNKAASRQASQQASQQQSSQPASQQASPPASQKVIKQASQQASMSASKQARHPASRPASQQASNGTNGHTMTTNSGANGSCMTIGNPAIDTLKLKSPAARRTCSTRYMVPPIPEVVAKSVSSACRHKHSIAHRGLWRICTCALLVSKLVVEKSPRRHCGKQHAMLTYRRCRGSCPGDSRQLFLVERLDLLVVASDTICRAHVVEGPVAHEEEATAIALLIGERE